MTTNYGDKRDYPRIDVYVDGVYVASTNWAASCAQAVRVYSQLMPVTQGKKIVAFFGDSQSLASSHHRQPERIR